MAFIITTNSPYLPISSYVWDSKNSPNKYNPPPFGDHKTINVMIDKDLMKYVIGKNGICFKAITHQVNGVLYIWYNSENMTIEVWGMYDECIDEAIDRINKRIKLIAKQNSFIIENQDKIENNNKNEDKDKVNNHENDSEKESHSLNFNKLTDEINKLMI